MTPEAIAFTLALAAAAIASRSPWGALGRNVIALAAFVAFTLTTLGGIGTAAIWGAILLGTLVVAVFVPARPSRAVAMAGRIPVEPGLAVGTVIAFVTTWPTWGHGYVFALDMISGPAEGSWQAVLAPTGTEIMSWPWHLARQIVLLLLPAAVFQRVILFVAMALLAWGAYRLPRGSFGAGSFAALLISLSPFVYIRAMTGQWYVILGLAALLWGARAILDWIDAPSLRASRAIAVWLALAGAAAQATLLLLGLVILLPTIALLAGPARRQLWRKTPLLALAIAAGTSFWTLPLLFGGLPSVGASVQDAAFFGPLVEPGRPELEGALTLSAFWRPVAPIAPPWVLDAIYLPALFLAVLGVMSLRRASRSAGSVAIAILGLAIIGALLGAGVEGPVGGVVSALNEDLPGYTAFRDSSKFLMLPVLAYAYLGGIGLDALWRTLQARVPSAKPQPRQWPPMMAFAILPVILLPGLIAGFQTQLAPQPYPDEWGSAVAALEAGPRGVLLALPLHQYMDLAWLEAPDKRVANPARVAFGGLTIVSDDPQIGSSEARDLAPATGAIIQVIQSPETKGDVATALAKVGVSHIALLKDAQWQPWDAILRGEPNLTAVVDGPTLVLFRNDRFESLAHDGQGQPLDVVQPLASTIFRVRTEGSSELALALGMRTGREWVATGYPASTPCNDLQVCWTGGGPVHSTVLPLAWPFLLGLLISLGCAISLRTLSEQGLSRSSP